MRARRVGTTPELRLFQDEQEIGSVDGTRARFRGFASRDDAALAASVAALALTRRRGGQPHSVHDANDVRVVNQGGTEAVVARTAVLGTLLPPDPDEPESSGWGFEIALLPEERFEVFAVGRARVMWRALRSTGVYRRMRQFGAEHLASA
jgi:hypothetical protein